MRPIAIFAILALVATEAMAQADTSTRDVLIGSASEALGAAGGLARIRLRQPIDSLGTRPSVFVMDISAAAQRGWRASISNDAWTTGNARRLVMSAFASELPVVAYAYDLTLSPRRFGADITPHWKRSEHAWWYLNLSWRRNEGDHASLPGPTWTPIPCDTTAPCGIPARASLSVAPGMVWYGVGSSRYRMWTGRMGHVRDTRDNILAPASGSVFDISAAISQVGYESLPQAGVSVRADLRRYRTTASGGVLAFQGQFMFESDEIPFDEHMASESPLRGFAPTLSTAESLVRAQGEWRSPIHSGSNRVGYAVFGAMQLVTTGNTERGTQYSAGLGLRYRLDRGSRNTLRLDYGYGVEPNAPRRTQHTLTLALQEAF